MHKSGKKKNPPQDDKVNCRLQQAVANHKSPISPLAELSSKPHLTGVREGCSALHIVRGDLRQTFC